MLIIADESRVGVVNMPTERLAARAGLSVEDTIAGLAFLNSPDPESHSDEEGGRRIVRLREASTREWKLVNWEKYQAIAKEEQRREETRLRVSAWRKRSSSNADVTTSNALEVEVPAPEQAEAGKSSPTRTRADVPLFAEDSPEMKAAIYLFELIRYNNPHAKEPNLAKWAREFDLIFRVDGRSAELVRRVIDFCQTDTFWQKNILSPATLRAKFDRLTVSAKPPAPKRTVMQMMPRKLE